MSGRRRSESPPAAPARRVRCAVYTRKSSDEGLDQEFNSLDAQRESAEAFIASQKAEGWVCLADRYDDGGYSGGSMERPALDRLLRDVGAGKVDCVVVYKVDRLSRSLLDFGRIMEAFDRHGVSFVSVTQQFNTTSSMGRLTLNILLSFAQFEREIIGERIRDKIAARKRRGKWAGGAPVLGYDVDRSGPSPRLVVNAAEAGRVREIFGMYLDKGSLLPVVTELGRRGWANKRRVTRKGDRLGGRPFDKATLYGLLTNPIYAGKIAHKGAVYDGEHEAIIDAAMFDRVRALLKANGRTGGAEVRNRHGALLRGLLRCKACGHAMTHTFTGGRKGRCYRYYRCVRAIKSGSATCPSGTLPAGEIERVVIDEVRGLVRDPALLGRVLEEAQSAIADALAAMAAERDGLRSELDRDHRRLRRLAAEGAVPSEVGAEIADLNDRIAAAERRLPEVEAGVARLERETVGRSEAETALADFETAWQSLSPREQSRLLRLLIAAVEYDREPERVGDLPPVQYPRPGRPSSGGGCVTTVTRSVHFALEGRRERAAVAPTGAGSGRSATDRPAGEDAAGGPVGRVPRVARLMALAIRFDGLLREGVVENQTELARLARVTQPRMTQIMNLLHLAPDIQEKILFLRSVTEGRDPVTERELRVLTGICLWGVQRAGWSELKLAAARSDGARGL